MLGLFLLGFLNKKLGAFSAKVAAIVGLCLIAWLSFKDMFPEALRSPFDPKMTVVLGTIAIVGIGMGVEWLRALKNRNHD
jgi:hypothetical protein